MTYILIFSNRIIMSILITYIVTAYNEEKNLYDTIEEILKLKNNIKKFEILIINDGSTDNTQKVIDKLKLRYSSIRSIQHKINLGFGATYRTGFKNAKGTYCILIPGDNAHPADTIIPLLEKKSSADIIIPYTLNPEVRSVFRQVLSKVFVFNINLISGLNVKYYNGLVLHRTKLLNLVNSKTTGYAYQAEILVKLIKSGASYVHVGTLISERELGQTKAFKFSNILKVLSAYLILLRYCCFPPGKEQKELTAKIKKLKNEKF